MRVGESVCEFFPSWLACEAATEMHHDANDLKSPIMDWKELTRHYWNASLIHCSLDFLIKFSSKRAAVGSSKEIDGVLDWSPNLSGRWWQWSLCGGIQACGWKFMSIRQCIKHGVAWLTNTLLPRHSQSRVIRAMFIPKPVNNRWNSINHLSTQSSTTTLSGGAASKNSPSHVQYLTFHYDLLSFICRRDVEKIELGPLGVKLTEIRQQVPSQFKSMCSECW